MRQKTLEITGAVCNLGRVEIVGKKKLTIFLPGESFFS